MAAVLVNTGLTTVTVTAQFSDLGLAPGSPALVRDIWAHKDMGLQSQNVTATLKGHSSAMYILKPTK